MQDFFKRLRDEREALGLTQDVMAKKVGVSKRSYCAYEAGETAPSAKLLAALANMGVDIAYLLTGNRSRPAPPKYVAPPDEERLLDAYRHSSAEVRAVIMGATKAAALAARDSMPASVRRKTS